MQVDPVIPERNIVTIMWIINVGAMWEPDGCKYNL